LKGGFTLASDNASAHTVGGRILALRSDRDVSQLELAAALKISTSALRNLEYGYALPRLATLEQLSDFFNVSIDYLVRGVSSGNEGNLDVFRDTGLTDISMAFLKEQIDLGKNCGGLNEYITTLNALVSNGLLTLVWTLNRLNRELDEVDAEIEQAGGSAPEPEDIVKAMELSAKLEPLKERRDLLKLRYLRSVEKVFDGLIKEGAE
jgi:transcriptional regulator with XRE-family HTH domain